MQTIDVMIVFLAGVFVRLAAPLAITLTAIYFLRRLDARWQAEAHGETGAQVEKPKCWEIKDCPPARRQSCRAFDSAVPCWQVFRLRNGYLREACLTCQVFRHAPAPANA